MTNVLKLVAKLTSDSIPLANKTIIFEKSVDGVNFQIIGTGVTNENGEASITDSTTTKTYYRARFNGDEEYQQAISNIVEFTPPPPPPEEQPTQPQKKKKLPWWLLLLGVGLAIATSIRFKKEEEENNYR